MRKHLKRALEGLIKISIAAAILAWLYNSGNLRFDFIKALIEKPFVLMTCLAMTFGSIFLNNERWRVLLISQGLVYSRLETLKLTFIGLFFNFSMPGGVGGDIVKSFYLTRAHQNQKTKSILTVLMDRLIGLHAILFLGFVAMFVDLDKILSITELKFIFTLFSVVTLGYTVAALVCLSRNERVKTLVKAVIKLLPMKHRLTHIYETMNSYGDQKMALLTAYIYSLMSQSLAIVFMYLVSRVTYAGDISAHSFFIVVPIGFILTAIPISPAGVGIGQAAFLFLFGIYNPELKFLGPSSLTAWQTSLLLFAMVGAVLYLFNRSAINNAEKSSNNLGEAVS